MSTNCSDERKRYTESAVKMLQPKAATTPSATSRLAATLSAKATPTPATTIKYNGLPKCVNTMAKTQRFWHRYQLQPELQFHPLMVALCIVLALGQYVNTAAGKYIMSSCDTHYYTHILHWEISECFRVEFAEKEEFFLLFRVIFLKNLVIFTLDKNVKMKEYSYEHRLLH